MAGPSADAYLCHRRLSLRSRLLRLRVVQHHDWRTSVTNQPFRDLNPRRCRASSVLRRPVRHLVGGTKYNTVGGAVHYIAPTVSSIGPVGGFNSTMCQYPLF